MIDEKVLNSRQIALIRTLWELAQARIDALYTSSGAEEEKQAIEESMKRVFPSECAEFIRSEGEQRG